MPLYEYECDVCGERFEVIQKFSDDPLTVCRLCGKGPVHKLFSSPAIQFKGSGWYITDYAQKGKTESTPKTAGDKGGDSATTSQGSAATSDSTTKTETSSTTTSKETSSGASKESKS